MNYIEYLSKFSHYHSADGCENYIFFGEDMVGDYKPIQDALDYYFFYGVGKTIKDWYDALAWLAGRTDIKHRVSISHSALSKNCHTITISVITQQRWSLVRLCETPDLSLGELI